MKRKRLELLKEMKYLTQKIFQRISENLHYELFKYSDCFSLLEIRSLNLGGFQLISNNILRQRIGNYFKNIKFNSEITSEYTRKIKLIFEQTGKNHLIIDSKINGDPKICLLSKILLHIPELVILNMSIYIYIYRK